MIEIEHRLTKQQVEALAGGASLRVTLLPPSGSRKGAARAERPDARLLKVLEQWNGSRAVREAFDTARNNRTDPSALDDSGTRKLFEKAVERLGLPAIRRRMAEYLEAVEDGRHIWDDRNHGYKDCVTFLRKLLELDRRGGRPYWSRSRFASFDAETQRLARRIRRAYAERFGGLEGAFDAGTPEGQAFCRAARAISEMADRWGERLGMDELIGLALARIEDDAAGRAPAPADVGRAASWRAGLEASLRELG